MSGFKTKGKIMIYFLSIAGHEQEISLENLNEMIPILLANGFGFSVRTKRK
jgi:hypothetical protein